MICNSKITRNEVKETEESTAKRSCGSQCQPQSPIQDASHTSDKQACEQESSHHLSAFSENAIKCANSLFSSKYHQRDFCKEADCCSVSKNEAQQQRKQSYKFQHSWLFKTSLSFCLTTEIWWAVYVEGEGLYCLLCRKHDTSNPQNKSKIFNKEPCKRFRPEALADHLQTIQHKNAVSAEMLQRVSCFQKTLDEREKVAEDVLVKVFTAVYWLMKEELPNNKIKSLLQLLEQVGMNDLKHFLHRSQGALKEIFLTLGKTVQDTFLCKLKQAAHFGLLVDDVTDISVAEQMISFAQFYNKSGGEVETGFLSINNLLEDSPSADASTITNCIIKTMDKFSLDSKKLASFVSDGASVMTGSRSGVATRLKELNPQLINFHCICHRLALACTDTLTSMSYISSVLKWLSQLWYLFQNSPKKMAVYLKTQAEMKELTLSTDKARCQVTRRLKKACTTRWLSFDASVKAVYSDYPALLHTLNSLKDGDATSLGLFTKVKDVKFIGTVYILSEVLPHLSNMSKIFQKGAVDFSRIAPTIEYTMEQLDEAVETKSPISKLKQDLQENGRLGLLDMNATQYHYQVLENLLCNYVDALKTNIENRFHESLPVVSAWSIFDPLKVPNKDHPGFKLYGKPQVQTIADHFTKSIPADQKESIQEEMKTEFAKLKYDMIRWKQDLPLECNPSEFPCKVTATEWCLQRICSLSHFYPQLSNVADIMLSTPVSNAWPERGASCVKRVKTRFRSTLKNDMLQSLMHVSINGPVAGTEDAENLIERSVKDWTTAKNRRKLPRSQGTVQPQQESQERYVVDAVVQTDAEVPTEEIQISVSVEEEVEAFYNACDLPDAPDDVYDDDEGFDDDGFYED